MWTQIIADQLGIFAIWSCIFLAIPMVILLNVIVWVFPPKLLRLYTERPGISTRDAVKYLTSIGQMQLAIHASVSICFPEKLGKRFQMTDFRKNSPWWFTLLSFLFTVLAFWLLIAMLCLAIANLMMKIWKDDWTSVTANINSSIVFCQTAV